MYTLKGAMSLRSDYRGATYYLSEQVFTKYIQHEVHTTRLYNMPIQHANQRIKWKIKTSFY